MTPRVRPEVVGSALLVAVIAVAMSWVQLPIPPGRDQGIFLYHGQAILDGLVPYRDMWDHKPPGVYALYALALALFGDRYESPNLLDVLFRAATAAALYGLGARLFGRREGLAAGIVFAVWSATAGSTYWSTAQAESFMSLPLVLALLLWMDGRRSTAAATGVAIALACVLKPTALLFIAVPLALEAALCRTGERPWREGCRRSALLALGGIAVAVGVTAVFAAAGAAGHMWQALVEFNRDYAGKPMPVGWLSDKLEELFRPLAPALLVAGVALLGDPRRRRPLLLGWLYLLVIAAMVVVQRKYFHYHMLIAVAPLALLAGYTLALPFRSRAEGVSPVVRAIAAAGAIVGFALTGPWLARAYVAPHYERYATIDYVSGDIDRDAYIRSFRYGYINLSETHRAAAYLRQHTAPTDTVLMWGNEPLVNYWSGRRTPGRFNFDHPLSVESESPRALALRARLRDELMRDLAARPPAYVVVIRDDKSHMETMDSVAQLEQFPALLKWLSESYATEVVFGDLALLRRTP